MLYRVLAKRGAVSFAALIVLAVALCGLTAGAEAFYYHLKTNADMLRVLSANLSLGIGVRPAWLVGGIGLLVALLSLARPFWSKNRDRRTAPARA
jgi:sulfoxide reductase heme-binding subunit YedZ